MKKAIDFLCLVVLIFVVACQKEECQCEETVGVTGIFLSHTSLTLSEDEVFTLDAEVAPENASNKNVLWSSSEPSVIYVDGGALVAKRRGNAVVIAKSVDGGKIATCQITVSPKKDFRYTVKTIVEHYHAVNGEFSIGALTQWDQSMAIFNDKIFLFLDSTAETAAGGGYSFVVLDYNTKEVLYKGLMPSKNSHHNNAQFLDVFYQDGDVYPLLLMSRGDYPGALSNQFYIMRVQERDGQFSISIVKTITCSIPQANYGGNWVCSADKLYMYTMAKGDWRVREEDGNRFVIYEFKMFNALDSEQLTISEDDVVRMTRFNYCILQGGTTMDGKLYLPIQSYSKINDQEPLYKGHIIAIINPDSGKVENTIPSDSLENEGIAIYNGKLYVSSKNGSGNVETPTPVFRIQEFEIFE